MSIHSFNSLNVNSFIQLIDIKPTGSGILNNLTFAIKDIIDIKGFKTSLGNPTFLEACSNATSNAACIEQLLAAGARCVGKTVLSEFGSGMTGVNPFYGTPINPNASNRYPGGSSSGSASLVAAGLVDFALGTDAGGSIRVPASFCGIYGMRPSHGAISFAGIHKLSTSFDTVGVLTRSVEILSKVMSSFLGSKITPLFNVDKIYYPENTFDFLDAELKKSIHKFLELLSDFLKKEIIFINYKDIDKDACDSIKGLANTFKTILCKEMWDVIHVWFKQLKLEYGSSTYLDINSLKKIDENYISQAFEQQIKYAGKLNNLLFPNNLICIPTAPDVAPIRNEQEKSSKNINYLNYRQLLSLSSLGKLPQISIPFKTPNNIPFGISLLGASGRDINLLSIVDYLDKSISKINY